MSKNQVAKAAFDLDAVDTVDEAQMTVVVNGNVTDWVWTFAGPGHEITIEQGNRIAREALRRDSAQEQAQVNGKKWHAPERTVQETRERNIGFVVERLLGWSDATVGGKPFPFSKENARELLSDYRKASLLKQALEFLGDEHSFAKRSANS